MQPDASFWDNLAERYAAKPVDDPAAFERKIEITRAQMRPDAVVLDIGCGTGSLALRLADAGAQIHGLDLSPEMIRIAREKRAAQASDNVTFHVGAFDADFTAIAPGSLDGLCAYSLLHLVHDRAAVLTRIADLLKPGGFFVSSTACLGESWVPYRPLLAVMRWLGKAPMVKIISKATLRAEIEAAGFISVEAPEVGAAANIGFMLARKP